MQTRFVFVFILFKVGNLCVLHSTVHCASATLCGVEAFQQLHTPQGQISAESSQTGALAMLISHL